MIKALHTTLPLPSKINQIDGLQILRAVAVLLVAWVHAGQWLKPFGERPLPTLGAYGIDIFFVISGFIVSSVVLRTRQKPGVAAMWEFLKRRLIRIFPIYWFFCLLQSGRLLHNHQMFQKNYLPALFLLPGLREIGNPLLIGFSWTMVFEMFFYLTLAATLLGTVRRAVPAAIAIFCGSIVVGGIFDIRRPVWIVVCNPIVLEFVFGALLALAYRRFGQRRRLGIVLLVLGTAASIGVAMLPSAAIANGQQMVLADDGAMARVLSWGVTATMLVGGMVFWSPAIRSLPGRVAVVLGNSSYSAYLASAMVIEFTTRFLLKFFGNTAFSTARVAGFQIVATVAVFAAGWICYQCIEWPMLRWLRTRFLAETS